MTLTLTSSQPSQIQHVLCTVPSAHLSKLLTALSKNRYSVKLTSTEPNGVEIFVTNAHGRTQLVIFETPENGGGASCICYANSQRGMLCSHILVAALSVLQIQQPTDIYIHLVKTVDGLALCGVSNPVKHWLYPFWPSPLGWDEACPDCESLRQQPRALKEAA